MKKVGGTRASSARASGTAPREPWRKWVMTLLALGFAMLVITLLAKENKLLGEAVADLRSATKESEQEEAVKYPLSFDLPAGWSMNEGCTVEIDGEVRHVGCGDTIVDIETMDQLPVLDTDIDPNAYWVYLQNTEKLPLFGGIGPNAAVASAYQSKDVALITIAKIDSQEILTGDIGEVTDMGGNFYKVQTCDVNVSGPECEIYGHWANEYYFFGETGTYRMSVSSTWSGGAEAIEEIILSAREE